MDDLSVRAKMYWGDMDVTSDPVRGIAERYLREAQNANDLCWFKETYQEILDERYGHMKQFISEFNVNEVVLFI